MLPWRSEGWHYETRSKIPYQSWEEHFHWKYCKTIWRRREHGTEIQYRTGTFFCDTVPLTDTCILPGTNYMTLYQIITQNCRMVMSLAIGEMKALLKFLECISILTAFCILLLQCLQQSSITISKVLPWACSRTHFLRPFSQSAVEALLN